MRRLELQTKNVNDLFHMLGIVANGAFTETGQQMMWLPEVGGVRWRCILANAAKAGIGREILLLCAGIMVLPNSRDGILQSLPAFCTDMQLPGDISGLYLLFRAAYTQINRDEREQSNTGVHLAQFVRRHCGGNLQVFRVLRKFGSKYRKLREKIGCNMNGVDISNDERNFLRNVLSSNRQASLDDVCKAVMRGFVDRIAISQKLLGGRSGSYTLLYKHEEGQRDVWQGVATLKKQSKIARKPKDAEDFVFGLDLSHIAMSESTPTMLSMANKMIENWFQEDWLPPTSIYFPVHDSEVPNLQQRGLVLGQRGLQCERVQCGSFNHAKVHDKHRIYKLTGHPKNLFRALRHLHSDGSFVSEYKLLLQPPQNMADKFKIEQYLQNVQLYRENVNIFNQWINHWQNNHQVNIRWKFQLSQTDPGPFKLFPGLLHKDVPHFICSSRVIYKEEIQAAVEATGLFLSRCAGNSNFSMTHDELQVAVCKDPHVMLSYLQQRPHRIEYQGSEYDKMRGRIAQCTQVDRTPNDLWEKCHGREATRGSRMAAVAWLAVTKFKLKLKGGFIRDWVVPGFENVKDDTGADLPFVVTNTGFRNRPVIDGKFVPQDLDFQMPPDEYFDVQAFKVQVENLGIKVTQVHMDSLLIVIVFDAPLANEDPPLGSKGPFTAEMTLPHIAPTMVDVDFCVNNLSVMRDFPKDLCMRVPVPKLTVDLLIERCFQKQFQLCKPQDGVIKERIERMEKKGFQRIKPDLQWLPDSNDVTRCLVDHGKDEEARKVVDFLLEGKSLDDPNNPMKHLALPPTTTVVKVWKVKNALLERIYEAHREMIKRENDGDENEQYGWHAPGNNSEEVRSSICRLGIDNRWWERGFFGNAAYLAKYPLKSQVFAQKQANTPKVIFLFKVLCGKQEVVHGEGHGGQGAKDKFKPSMHHHSVLGKGTAVAFAV